MQNGRIIKIGTLVIILIHVVFSSSSLFAANEIKLAHMFAPESIPGKSAVKFAEIVADKSNNEIKITVIPGGALGNLGANLKQIKSGSIDMIITGSSVIDRMASPYMLMTMPFVYRDVDHALSVFNGDLGTELNKYLFDNHNIFANNWQYVGTRELTSNKPVKNLADLKGLKLRLPSAQTWVNTWNQTEVEIASISFTELYLALQTGTVSAQENPPSFIMAQKFYEVQKYLVLTNHFPQMQSFLMNADLWRSLSDEQKKIIVDSEIEAGEWTTKLAEQSQEDDIKWLIEKGGMELIKPDLSGIDKLIQSVPESIDPQNGKALYNRIVGK